MAGFSICLNFMWNIGTFVLLLMRLLQPVFHQLSPQSPDISNWGWTMFMSEKKQTDLVFFCCKCIFTCVCQLSFYLSSDVYMSMFEWTQYIYAFLYTMYVHILKRCFTIINIFIVFNSFILSLWLTTINCVEPFQAKAGSFSCERFICNWQSFYFTDKC